MQTLNSSLTITTEQQTHRNNMKLKLTTTQLPKVIMYVNVLYVAYKFTCNDIVYIENVKIYQMKQNNLLACPLPVQNVNVKLKSFHFSLVQVISIQKQKQCNSIDFIYSISIQFQNIAIAKQFNHWNFEKTHTNACP